MNLEMDNVQSAQELPVEQENAQVLLPPDNEAIPAEQQPNEQEPDMQAVEDMRQPSNIAQPIRAVSKVKCSRYYLSVQIIIGILQVCLCRNKKWGK